MAAGWLAGAVTVDGSVENFKRQRQTEIKHGRPCMLAVAIWDPGINRGCVIVTHGLPGESTTPWRGLGIYRGCATFAHGLP
eukprot:12892677-Prorocentrum_lima.AAC.1